MQDLTSNIGKLPMDPHDSVALLHDFNKHGSKVIFPPISQQEKVAEQYLIYNKRENIKKNLDLLKFKKRNVTTDARGNLGSSTCLPHQPS